MTDGTGRPIGSRYVAGERIGRGAMGQVFAGVEHSSGDSVAIKVLRSELVDDPEFVTRFLQERALLVGLRGAHLVPVRDLVAEGDTLAIVMERVHGPDLRRFVGPARTLPPAVAAALCADALDGLVVAHAAGIIHRDIKPENILVDLTDPETPMGMVTDFGIARAISGPSLTRLTGVIGTPEYMAPELAEHGVATGAADVYTVGIMCFELCAGRTPFAGGHALAVLRRHADAAVVFPHQVPESLQPLLGLMLAKRPDERPEPQTARDALRDLAPGLRALPAATPLPAEASVPAYEASADDRITLTSQRSGGPDTAETGATRHVQRPRRETPPLEIDEPPGRRRRSRRTLLVAAIAAVAALVVGVSAIALSRSGKAAAHVAAVWTRSFAPFAYPNGVLVGREWILAPDGKRLDVAYTVTNPTSRSMKQTVRIAVPKVVASSVDQLSFKPSPTVIRRDPIVAYPLTLGPRATKELRYSVTLASRPDAKTLTAWIAATEQARKVDERASHTATRTAQLVLSISPATLTLDLTHATSQHLTLSGRIGHTTAPAAQLANASWTSSNPAIAAVAPDGTVTAVTKGTATITAEIGGASARAAVSVSDATQPASVKIPPGQRSTSPTPPTQGGTAIVTKPPDSTTTTTTTTAAATTTTTTTTAPKVAAPLLRGFDVSGGGGVGPFQIRFTYSGGAAACVLHNGTAELASWSCVVGANSHTYFGVSGVTYDLWVSASNAGGYSRTTDASKTA